jgi:single-stranded DNA-binding protein
MTRTSLRKEEAMELNLVVLSGRLATAPEERTFDSGSTMLRLLVTVRSSEPRRRVDVIPVTVWNPDPELIGAGLDVGQRVWVAGSVQRRFWSAEHGRRSRLEVVAHEVSLRDDIDLDVEVSQREDQRSA